MKECERITDLFGELHDDEADGDAGDFVRDHLYNCPGCREDYKWYTLTIQALGSLETASPPGDFLAQLSARLEPEPSSNSFANFFRNIFSHSPYMPLPVGVVALVLVAVIGTVVYNTSSVVLAPLAQVGTSESAGHTGVIPGAKHQGIVARNTPSGPAIPFTEPSTGTFPGTNPRPANPEDTLESRPHFPTIADLIGGDNLTVESPRVDQALESFKKMLPDIRGRLVGENDQGNPRDVVLTVLIPSDSYGHLTTELIKHGAVASGAVTEDGVAFTPRKDGNSVLLHIRFVSSR